MRTLVRIFIRSYQIMLSPLLSALAGPHSGCRFSPTCSEYFLRAVEEYGLWRGGWLGGKRLMRCHPWGGSGWDPVLPRAAASDRGYSVRELKHAVAIRR
jgi:uncharacterized protein